MLGGSKDQQEEPIDEEDLLDEDEEEEAKIDRRMAMVMVNQISRFYQRMVCSQETMITLK